MVILERDNSARRTWYGDLPVTSRYTYGIAGERFFRAIKDDAKILGTRCPNCDRIFVPGVIFCERCLDKLDEWIDVGTIGTVHTFTVLYKNYDGTVMDKPEIIAFIEIGDGGLIHKLGEISPENVKIDMQVAAVFKPAEEREGSILDIIHFQPI